MIDKFEIADKFKENFGSLPSQFFVSPGRLEIIGNHTDHNGGLALVGSANLYIDAACKENDKNEIHLISKGMGEFVVKCEFSLPDSKQFSTTNALISGILSGFLQKKFKVGGLDIYCESEIPTGSGVSSSAAFELLICECLNYYFNKDEIDKLSLVKISQMAEREYFGKPCGMLDQIGVAYGGVSLVDFANLENPKIVHQLFPFNFKIMLTNPGGSHAGLDSLYASIPNDMQAVAHLFQKDLLREVVPQDFVKAFNLYPNNFTNSMLSRATHFFNENNRVVNAFSAIKNLDEEAFLTQIRESGDSSSKILQNTLVEGRFENSPERALQIARETAPKSAHRVHGGGFMGTIISFCVDDEYQKLKDKMIETFGENSVIDVGVSPFGTANL